MKSVGIDHLVNKISSILSIWGQGKGAHHPTNFKPTHISKYSNFREPVQKSHTKVAKIGIYKWQWCVSQKNKTSTIISTVVIETRNGKMLSDSLIHRWTQYIWWPKITLNGDPCLIQMNTRIGKMKCDLKECKEITDKRHSPNSLFSSLPSIFLASIFTARIVPWCSLSYFLKLFFCYFYFLFFITHIKGFLEPLNCSLLHRFYPISWSLGMKQLIKSLTQACSPKIILVVTNQSKQPCRIKKGRSYQTKKK